MKNQLNEMQIQSYRSNGYIIIKDFLSQSELRDWRSVVEEAVQERDGRKFPNREIKTGEDDGLNEDADYYGKVFDQILNLWQTNEGVKKIMLDERIGKMAAQLSGQEGIRIWHDQILFKGLGEILPAGMWILPSGHLVTGKPFQSG